MGVVFNLDTVVIAVAIALLVYLAIDRVCNLAEKYYEIDTKYNKTSENDEKK